MKRDPIDKYIRGHIDSISVKKIKPRFSYKKCSKCGMEYKKEEMYKCSAVDIEYDHFLRLNKFFDGQHVFGCEYCFSSKYDFLKWLKDNGAFYTEEELKVYYLSGRTKRW